MKKQNDQKALYEEKYGSIPKDPKECMDYLLSKMKMSDKKMQLLTNTITTIKKISWKELSFTIYLLPKATPRPRTTKNGHFYVMGAGDNKKFFKEFISDQNVTIITTPIKFECRTYFPIPSSMNNIEKICAEMGLIRPISKPDWDNVAKTYCDMITNLLIYDDSLIIDGRCEKYYSVKPRIEIVIRYMEDFDSIFNKKKMLKNLK